MSLEKKREETTAGSSHSKEKTETPTAAAATPTKTSFLDRFPPWVKTNVTSPRSLKLLFRCWVGSWAAFVLILPNRSLQRLGTTAFFTLLSSFFLPANLPVQMFLILITTLLLGVASGWALGAAAMKAALSARSQSLILAVEQRVIASIQDNPTLKANPIVAIQIAAFAGEFLDVRSSVIYGVFLAVGCFFFALLRAYIPKAVFMSIYGTIALDIFCTIGPLIPTKNYLILEDLVIAIACYIAIVLITTTCIFPETMNHLCLLTISGQLSRLKGIIAVQDKVLKASAKDLTLGTPLLTEIRAGRTAAIATQQQLAGLTPLINLEFTRGKWNGDDVKELEEPLLTLVTRVAGLTAFSKLYGDTHVPPPPSQPSTTASSSTSTLQSTTLPATAETYLLKQMHQRRISAETAFNLDMESILPFIRESTEVLRGECIKGLGAAQDSINNVNTTRWTQNLGVDAEKQTALEGAIASLTTALESFKSDKRMRLIEPFLPAFTNAQTHKEQESLPLRSLYLSFVFGANLINTTSISLQFMEKVSELSTKRKGNRFWFPKGLRTLGKVFTMARGSGAKTDQAFGDEVLPEAFEFEEVERRDPDSRTPTNGFQRVMDRLHWVYKWCGTAEAKFTFKYTVVSVALWLPAVFKSSAHFYYTEKGLWGMIMAQTTVNIYAADQIYNLVTRLIGTLVGLVVGLVVWYIGSGSGNGNPYGLVASMAVFLVPVVWLRLYVPQQYLVSALLSCATFVLIVGYSWIDGHAVQVAATPGVGWSVAWRRWVLVCIGSLASFIVMMFPPTSGRKAVRMNNAATIDGIANLYGFLVSTWIQTKDTKSHHKREGSSHAPPAVVWGVPFRAKLLALGKGVGDIKALTALAKWEGSIRGAWPGDEYVKLSEVESDMVGCIAQLAGALGHMDDSWRLTFTHNSRVLNPNFIADVMSIFSLVSQSLRTGAPMHQVLPTSLLDRLFYHHHHHRTVHLPSSDASNSKGKCVEVTELESLDYMYYAQGIVAVYQLLQCLDELHRITKRLCGEIPLTGFKDWRDDFEKQHTHV